MGRCGVVVLVVVVGVTIVAIVAVVINSSSIMLWFKSTECLKTYLLSTAD